MTAPQQRIFGLDLLRAAAILCVLHAHTARIVGSQRQTDIALNYFGFVGVEIFFVLSGFLIGTILLKLVQDPAERPLRQTGMFWVRRWFRTLPNYYLAFLLYVLWIWQATKLNILRFPDYQRFLWFGENLFRKPPALYTIAWSLAIEEWFYLLFPMLILGLGLLWRKRSIHLVGVASGILMLGCLIGRMAMADAPGYNWPEQFRKLVPLHLDGIAIGVFFAYLKCAVPQIWLRGRWPALALGVVGLVGMSWLFFAQNMFRGASATWFDKTFFISLWSVAIGLLLPVFSGWERLRPRFLQMIIGFVANISYSLYLYHMTVLLILNNLYLKDFYGWGPWAVAWACSIAVSALVYYAFERPVLKLRDRLGRPRDRVSVQG